VCVCIVAGVQEAPPEVPPGLPGSVEFPLVPPPLLAAQLASVSDAKAEAARTATRVITGASYDAR